MKYSVIIMIAIATLSDTAIIRITKCAVESTAVPKKQDSIVMRKKIAKTTSSAMSENSKILIMLNRLFFIPKNLRLSEFIHSCN